MSMNGRRRVVITGMGAVSPLGNDFETSWENLTAGRSGAAEIKGFDASEYPVHFACELKDFEPADWIEKKQARRMDRFAQMIVAAAIQARDDAGLDIEGEADRIGASIATGIGGLKAFQDCFETLARARAGPREPVLDPADHPEHGRRLGLDVPRNPRAAVVAVHGLRRFEHGDRRGRRRDQARSRGCDARGRN